MVAYFLSTEIATVARFSIKFCNCYCYVVFMRHNISICNIPICSFNNINCNTGARKLLAVSIIDQYLNNPYILHVSEFSVGKIAMPKCIDCDIVALSICEMDLIIHNWQML